MTLELWSGINKDPSYLDVRRYSLEAAVSRPGSNSMRSNRHEPDLALLGPVIEVLQRLNKEGQS